MAKARVHELAKEFGVPSKDVLAALKDMGEFVKSASSTVEAPVARRLEELHGDAWKKAAEAKAAKKAAKKAPAKKAAADNGAPTTETEASRHETPVETAGGPAISDDAPSGPKPGPRATPAPSVESAPEVSRPEPEAEPEPDHEAPAAAGRSGRVGCLDRHRRAATGPQAGDPAPRQQPVLLDPGHAAVPPTRWSWPAASCRPWRPSCRRRRSSAEARRRTRRSATQPGDDAPAVRCRWRTHPRAARSRWWSRWVTRWAAARWRRRCRCSCSWRP